MSPGAYHMEERPAGVAAWIFGVSVIVSAYLHSLYLAEPWRVDWATYPMFVSDEGYLGLMARHVLQGARPVFNYGIYHQGAFPAYVAAPFVRVLGENIAALRLTNVLFAYVCTLMAYLIARRIYGRREGFFAASLVTLSPAYVFLWDAFAVPGYVGFAALVLIALYSTVLLLEAVTPARLVALGVSAGLSGWNNQLSLAFIGVIAFTVVVWVKLRPREFAILALAFLVGIGPLVYGNIVIPFASVRQFARKVRFAVTLVGQESERKATKADDDGFEGEGEEEVRVYRARPVLQVLGVQREKEGNVSLPGTPGALLLLVGFAWGVGRCLRARGQDLLDFRRNALLLACVCAAMVVGIAGWTGQPLGRYQLMLPVFLALLTAGWLGSGAGYLAPWILGLILVGRTVAIATPPSPGATPTEQVIEDLERHGLTRGYTAGPLYEIMFRSGERLIFVPLDHSRYVAYEPVVAAAETIAYIYRPDQEKKPAHKVFLRTLEAEGVTYETSSMGTTRILHSFQPREKITQDLIDRVRVDYRKEKFGG